MTALPDRGRLAVLPLPALLLLLHQQRFSGHLRLVRDAITRDVDLCEGRPTRVKTTALGAGLCARLVAAGRLSPQDAARVAARAPQLGGSEEKALLALKLLTPRALYLALREHERDVLLECFSWPDGSFELSVAAASAGDAATLGHEPLELVHAGMAAHWSAERTLAALAGAAQRYPSLDPSSDAVCPLVRRLPGFEPLHARLDGRVRLADAVAATNHPGAAAIAFVLDALGALAHLEEPLSDADEAQTVPTEAPSDVPEIEIVLADRASNAHAEGSGATDRPAGPAAGEHGLAAATRQALLEQQRRLANVDHYALLGVARNADVATVRRAYTTAAKRYHPDSLARLGLEDMREIANEVFAHISDAHAVLSDPAQRRDYDESLAGGGSDEAQRHVSAEIFYRKGEVLLRKGSFGEAQQFLRPAVELCPDEAAYRCALGWALFKGPTPDPDAARAELEHAATLDPRDAVVRERLGAVLRALGKDAEASAQLARARELKGRASQAR